MISNNDSNTKGEVMTVLVPKSLLIITNISKRANIRSLLQVGVAFGCTKILVVGQRAFNFTIGVHSSDNGNDSSATVVVSDIPKHLIPIFASGVITIERFEKWQNCVSYLNEHSIILIGVEIHVNSKTIQEICHDLDKNSVGSTSNNPGSGGGDSIAFLMGNEGTGLQEKQMNSCHMFCRIPQYGSGTASLNVYVAASIVLYHFHQYQQRCRQQQQQQREGKV